jgi:hypothetical protein
MEAREQKGIHVGGFPKRLPFSNARLRAKLQRPGRLRRTGHVESATFAVSHAVPYFMPMSAP